MHLRVTGPSENTQRVLLFSLHVLSALWLHCIAVVLWYLRFFRGHLPLKQNLSNFQYPSCWRGQNFQVATSQTTLDQSNHRPCIEFQGSLEKVEWFAWAPMSGIIQTTLTCQVLSPCSSISCLFIAKLRGEISLAPTNSWDQQTDELGEPLETNFRGVLFSQSSLDSFW